MMEELVPEAIDLKCYTFNGKTEFLHVLHTDQSAWTRSEEFYDAHTFEVRTKPYDGRLNRQRKQQSLYTNNQIYNYITSINYNALEGSPDDYLSKSIIEEAAKLCNYIGLGLDFARVDLMLMLEEAKAAKKKEDEDENDKEESFYFQFGEMTIYPNSGAQPFRPKQASITGNYWCLPKQHSIRD